MGRAACRCLYPRSGGRTRLRRSRRRVRGARRTPYMTERSPNSGIFGKSTLCAGELPPRGHTADPPGGPLGLRITPHTPRSRGTKRVPPGRELR